MEITEVRIKLMDDPQERLQAFCSITFDSCFVIRDLKIIEGAKGSFVAMPSRKLTDRCPQCSSKNHLRSLFCNQCGARLQEDRASRDNEGRAKLYADIAHPINSRCREMIQTQVLRAYDEELIKSKLPGYVCTYDDYGEDSYAALDQDYIALTGADGFAGAPETTHRIDGASRGPGGPHHAAPHRNVDHATAKQRDASEQEDGFGAGIL